MILTSLDKTLDRNAETSSHLDPTLEQLLRS